MPDKKNERWASAETWAVLGAVALTQLMVMLYQWRRGPGDGPTATDTFFLLGLLLLNYGGVKAAFYGKIKRTERDFFKSRDDATNPHGRR